MWEVKTIFPSEILSAVTSFFFWSLLFWLPAQKESLRVNNGSSNLVERSKQTCSFWRENQCQLTTQDIFTRIRAPIERQYVFLSWQWQPVSCPLSISKKTKNFYFKKKNVTLKCEMNTESKYNVMSVRNVVK